MRISPVAACWSANAIAKLEDYRDRTKGAAQPRRPYFVGHGRGLCTQLDCQNGEAHQERRRAQNGDHKSLLFPMIQFLFHGQPQILATQVVSTNKGWFSFRPQWPPLPHKQVSRAADQRGRPRIPGNHHPVAACPFFHGATTSRGADSFRDLDQPAERPLLLRQISNGLLNFGGEHRVVPPDW
jgi:hypothetical protein